MSCEDPKPIKRVSARKYRGAGDLVHALAQPLARVIDKAAGTKLESCQRCSRRRKRLNALVPFVKRHGRRDS